MGLLMESNRAPDSPELNSIEEYLSKPPNSSIEELEPLEDASHLPFPSRVLLLWVSVLLGLQAVLLTALLWTIITYAE